MRARLLHVITVFLIVYAATFYGMVEHIPLMKIAHQVGAATLFGLWIAALWRSRRGWPTTPLDGPIWGLLAASVVSAALAREPRVSLEYTWNYLVLALTFYVFVDLIRQGHARWLLEGVFLFAGVLTLVSLIEMLAWYFGWPIVPGFVVGWPQIAGFSLPPVAHHAALLLNNENLTAAYGVLLLPITLGWALTAQSRETRIGLGLLAGGVLLTTLFTQSRGAILALVVMAASAGGWAVSSTLLPRLVPARSRLRRSPYVFVAGLVLASTLATAGIVGMVVRSTGEVVRADMWLSAIRIFEDYPLLGAGPFQFGSTRYRYPNWIHSVDLDGFDHAHNLTLHLLAEGGALIFALATWLVVRALRLWWGAWHAATKREQLRLQAIALMLVGFVVHNAVDAFTGLRPCIIVLAMLANIAAPYRAPATSKRTRRLLTLSASALIVAQAAFVPVHLGLAKRQAALHHLGAGRLADALSAIREAQRLDPALDLYALEEAYILGLTAAEAPDRALEQAIRAHQEALDRVPVWDVGWNNLAGLYAQAGDFASAATAAQRATNRQPTMTEYQFQLGLHLMASGQETLAQTAFFRALELRPGLAASDYWSDPVDPRREVIRDAAIRHFADAPETATDIAMYSGKIELAAQLRRQVVAFTSEKKRRTYEATWGDPACPSCYYLPSDTYLIQAEHMLRNGFASAHGLSVEEAAKAALFVSEGQLVWANYILAQATPGDAPLINDLLFQAVPTPRNEEPRFTLVFYGLSSPLTTLPQARSPLQSRYEYAPWLALGERLREEGDWQTALAVYELILERDPYDRTAQQNIARLTGRTESELQ